MSSVIDLDGLGVALAGRMILKDLRGSLRGRAIGLLGPNGAGKTTLIHTLLGFHRPSVGTARIFGQDITTDAKGIRIFVGYMPERDSFIAKMTCVHFVRLMVEAFRDSICPRPACRDGVSDCLCEFSNSPYGD